ncbi:hypothetical protein HRI_004084800 [Hibiscus trionum]|uniref:Retrotransposon Copia-like N-terminal domain-containing protein n=1 Tax=Hibiscus trionum TaxID=183268 RepID=A0A9W7IY88_HIBTR|nr:hypothetical protein HRI_004084800 [Hibiscus trionum]
MASEVESSSSSKPFTNKTVSIRLDDSNYFLWKQQILFAVKNLALTDYIDGSLVVHPQIVFSEGGSRVSNPDYIRYRQEECPRFLALVFDWAFDSSFAR